MDELSSRFLDAFTAIEKWLKKELDAGRGEFGRLVEDMAAKNPGFRRHVEHLKAFAEVRNLIVHRYSWEQPLVIPSEVSLKRLLLIKDELVSSPSLIDFAASPVELCAPTDPLGCCVKKMHEGVFSQLPVHDGQKYYGLLTSETIARWLATFFLGHGDGIVEERPVLEVMQHQEHSDNYKFMAANSTVIKALYAFEEYQQRGRRLEAILITNLGRPTEALRGIVTINDIPKLTGAISG